MALAFGLISESRLARATDLFRLCKPLEANARHCAEAWGLEAPTIDVIDREDKLPTGMHPIVFVSDDSGDPGALAVHYYDPFRAGPAAIVYVDRASGWNSGSYSVSEAASHEVLEALCNPRLNIWRAHVDASRVGVQAAGEVADPCQDTYEIPAHGVRWKVSNFVTPAWFDAANLEPALADRVKMGRGFDYAKRLSRPGQVGPEGYVILRERGESGQWSLWYEDSSGQRFGSAPVKSTRQANAAKYDARRSNLIRRTAA